MKTLLLSEITRIDDVIPVNVWQVVQKLNKKEFEIKIVLYQFDKF